MLQQELNISIDLANFRPAELLGKQVQTDLLHYHRFNDFMAPIASGSFVTAGMVVCPCSGSTLSAIAHASGSNLIQRAAGVHLKEHRKLLLVPRETPLSLPQIRLPQMRVSWSSSSAPCSKLPLPKTRTLQILR